MATGDAKQTTNNRLIYIKGVSGSACTTKKWSSFKRYLEPNETSRRQTVHQKQLEPMVEGPLKE
jgi:hypothetical protein